MGRHVAPLMLVQGWLGQGGAGYPWERSRGQNLRGSGDTRKKSLELLPATEMLPAIAGWSGRVWEGGEGWLVCGQAAPEAPGLGRYIPSPDPKSVSSAGQGGL